jgi:purine-cytosine permease-like protein
VAESLVERRSIDVVPDEERHGTAFSQFTLWLGANLQITTVVTGGLAVVFGGDVVWSLLGLLAGNLVGGAVMALHSAQGPRLGLPQMISSRAQFGVKGAVVPLVLVVVMYVGYLISRERYDIPALTDPDGRYGGWRAIALTTYAIGLAAQFPFLSTSFYTGPVVGLLGGADISWIVGLVVPAVLYGVLARHERRTTAEDSGRPGGSGRSRRSGRFDQFGQRIRTPRRQDAGR